MSGYDQKAEGLDLLLDLDGYTAEIGDGFWVTMRAKRVEPTPGRSHGIQYALTLHSPGGERLVGYDNAHSAPSRSKPSRKSVRPVAFDHAHRRGKTRPYTFKTPADLLVDFWRDVEAVLSEEGVR